MSCQFKNEEGMCYLCKRFCKIREDFIPECKYYKRQFPEDKKILVERVQKALSKTLIKRDLFRNKPNLDIERLVDIKKSVYENVRFIINEFPTYTIEYRIRKKINPLFLVQTNQSPLESIKDNLYEFKTIEIIERDDKTKELLVIEGGRKYLCKIKVDLDGFFKGLGRKKKDYDYFLKHTIEVKPI